MCVRETLLNAAATTTGSFMHAYIFFLHLMAAPLLLCHFHQNMCEQSPFWLTWQTSQWEREREDPLPSRVPSPLLTTLLFPSLSLSPLAVIDCHGCFSSSHPLRMAQRRFKVWNSPMFKIKRSLFLLWGQNLGEFCPSPFEVDPIGEQSMLLFFLRALLKYFFLRRRCAWVTF